MTNPTSNFNWQMPTNTDLVTNLPADFAVFGDAVDATMADLKGGTTGQILSKATNTDMDFTWITNDVGDIIAITVTSPITGGGTSGSVGIAIQDGTTAQKGAVQLTDSTSSTSTTTAATPNAVKTSYDLANGAIAKTTVTTAGDIIYRNATVPTRLGIGTAGQVLQVNSGATAPEWATSASGGMTLLSTTSLSGVTTTVSSISGSYKELVIYLKDWYSSSDFNFLMTVNGDTTTTNYQNWYAGSFNGNNITTYGENNNVGISIDGVGSSQGANNDNFAVVYMPDYANATTKKVFTGNSGYKTLNPYKVTCNWSSYYNGTTAAITSISFKCTVGTWSGGSVEIYGVK